jgi:DNA-binding PadR family transcriptional regulator
MFSAIWWGGHRHGWHGYEHEMCGGPGHRGHGGGWFDHVLAMRGGPWRGRGGFGGRGGGGRVFGPGDLRLMLLALIAEKPSHGYELIKAIEEKFGGTYAPSPGSVYPTLTLLEELGHIRSQSSEGSKRLYEITEEGQAFMAENREAINGIAARMGFVARAMHRHSFPESVHEAMHTLRAALMFHGGDWDDEETGRVREILEHAAEAIGKRPGTK